MFGTVAAIAASIVSSAAYSKPPGPVPPITHEKLESLVYLEAKASGNKKMLKVFYAELASTGLLPHEYQEVRVQHAHSKMLAHQMQNAQGQNLMNAYGNQMSGLANQGAYQNGWNNPYTNR